jgi:hypothetical protein
LSQALLELLSVKLRGSFLSFLFFDAQLFPVSSIEKQVKPRSGRCWQGRRRPADSWQP